MVYSSVLRQSLSMFMEVSDENQMPHVIFLQIGLLSFLWISP